ncbi:MAG: TAXI family TRAP transporter solute-binding subunit [Pseudomonadota bacterium]
MSLAKRFLSVAVSLSLVAAYPAMFSSEVDARSRSGGYSKGWSSSGSYSKPSQSVWGQRSGGGIFGTSQTKTSVSGYSKPVPGTTAKPVPDAKSSAGYSKPGATGLGGTGFQPASPEKTPPPGYSKPGSSAADQGGRFTGGSALDQKIADKLRKDKAKSSLSTYDADRAGTAARGEGASTPSGGYAKPGAGRSSTAGAQQDRPGASSASGYAKPGEGDGTAAGTFSGGSKFDRSVSEGAAKERAKRSLSGYQGEKSSSTGPRPVDDVIGKIDRAHAQPRDSRGRFTSRAKTEAGETKSSDDSSGTLSRKRSAAAAGVGGAAVGSAFDRQVIENSRKQRSKDSLAAYQAEQSKFKKSGTQDFDDRKYADNPIYGKAGANPGFSHQDHYRQRDDYWRNQGVGHSSRMYGGPSSFGLWDAAFLYGMLSLANRPNSAAFAYHHQNDPGYLQWRRQAEEQAKTDGELRKQLAEMDKQVAAMKAQGVKVDPAYLPDGVPPELAVSSAVLAAKSKKKSVLRLATGQRGGMYYEFGRLLKKAAGDLDVEVIITEGSLENVDLLRNGKADAALVQSDLLTKIPDKETEQTVLYEEAIQLIANRSAGIKSVKDIDAKKNYIYVGPKGSGTAATWQELCGQDSAYAKIPVKHADYKTALANVATDPKALMLFVGGLNSPLLKAAEKYTEKSGKLRLAEVDDWDFNDKKDQHGNRIYTFITIGKKTYPNLQKGIIFSSKVETLAVKAVLTVGTDWVKKNGPHVFDSLTMAVKDVQPVMLKLVHGE